MKHSVLTCTNDAAAQDAAEAYVFQRMAASESEYYEEHLLICPRCQDAVQEFDVFLSAARIALAEDPRGRREPRAPRPRAKSASC
ncbi:MAG: hypothetical protein ABSH47_26055 [Bryobacteraceae bacterium]